MEVQCSTTVPLPKVGAMDIKVKAPGGFADAASQDKFCAGESCVIMKIYDQSPMGNHLAFRAHAKPWTQPAVANLDPLMVGGHKGESRPR